MRNSRNRRKMISSERVVWVSFLVDLSDVLINVIVAWFSGSVTMFAQAIEGGADLLSSGMLLIGTRKSKRPADKRHPYGHGRELYFWSFLSGLAAFSVSATLAFYWGLQRFLDTEPIENLGWVYLALIVSFFTNSYAFSLSYRRLLGRKGFTQLRNTFLHSALIETKTALIKDFMGVVASAVSLVALLLCGITGNLRFDGVGAMATGFGLAFFAFFILRSAKELLIGQSASPEVEAKIMKVVSSFSDVNAVLDLRTITIGNDVLLVNIEVHLKDKLTTDQIEALIDKIEQMIRKKIDMTLHIQIELETPDI